MLIHRLKVTGLLSFGPGGIDLPLKPLNVLIGPNGSESRTCSKRLRCSRLRRVDSRNRSHVRAVSAIGSGRDRGRPNPSPWKSRSAIHPAAPSGTH